jgi:hypothetical protein
MALQEPGYVALLCAPSSNKEKERNAHEKQGQGGKEACIKSFAASPAGRAKKDVARAS